jgi:hypothetical protein
MGENGWEWGVEVSGLGWRWVGLGYDMQHTRNYDLIRIEYSAIGLFSLALAL